MRSSSSLLDFSEHDDENLHDDISLQTVSGTVRGSKDGMAARGVNVHLVDADQAKTVTVKTDTNGNFTFSDVQSGTYTISVKETDGNPNSYIISRPMSSKIVTVHDGINIDRVILFRYGPSIVKKNNPSSLRNADNTVTCTDEYVSTTKGEQIPQNKLLQAENIAEQNKKNRALPEPAHDEIRSMSKIHEGNKNKCMRGLSIGTEDSWDNLKNDDDISFHDEAMDVIFEKFSGEVTVHHHPDEKGLNVTNVATSSMCMRGLSLGPEASGWEVDNTSGYPNNDENDDDMSFHDEIHLQKVSGTVLCSKGGTGVKGINVHLVDVGQARFETAIVKTDTNGNFTFSDVQSGAYTTCVQPLLNTPNASKLVTVHGGIDVDRVILQILQSHDSPLVSNDIDSDDSNNSSQSPGHGENKAGDEGTSMYSLHVAVISLAVIVLLKSWQR